MHFLQELVQDYLILAHPQADLPQIEHAEEITHGDKEEISTGSPLLWSFHHCFTDSNDAVFYSGRDSKESAETTGSIDDSGESEKLFSVSVYDKFLWMD